MRNAALVLGIIGGIIGMIVGFFGYGYTVAIEEWGEIDGLAEQVDNVGLIRTASLVFPVAGNRRWRDGAHACPVGWGSAADIGGRNVLCLWVQRVHNVPDRLCRAGRNSGHSGR